MEDDIVDESFLVAVDATKDIMRKRQDARSSKDGEVSLTGTIESYLTKTVDGGQTRNVNTSAPPPTEMKPTKDKKKLYPAAIPIQVRVNSLPLVQGEVEKRKDGKDGWQVRSKLIFFEEATKYLRQPSNLQQIWSENADEERQKMREYVDREGNLASTKWLYVSPGDLVKVKVPDQKDNIFRKENPDKPGMLLVQPSTPIKFSRIVAEVYVNIIDKKVDTTAAVEGEAAASDKDTESAAPTVAKAESKGIKILVTYPAYNCKGGTSISEDYDPNVARTERLHELEDADAHNMVPVDQLRDKKASAPRSAYFYVKKRKMTLWSPSDDPQKRGVTIVRSTINDMKDYMSEWQDVKKATCVVRFDVFQWLSGDKVKSANRYSVKVIGSGDQIWRNYGITSLEPYAMIVSANLELPVHIHATLWEKATTDHEFNKPEEMAKNSERPELSNIKGFYIYGGDIIPDFLRHFRTNGVRVSSNFVSKEFCYWESENRATKKTKVPLKPIDATKANPLNINGILSPVLALGNGYYPLPPANDPTPDKGLNHAFEGDIASLFEGGHEFFVLTSYIMNDDEKIKYTGPGGAEADAFISHLKNTEHIFYWIYAVRKDAKMARNFAKSKIAGQKPTTPLVRVPVLEVVEAKAEKREASEPVTDASEASVSESEASEGGNSTVRKRVRRTTKR